MSERLKDHNVYIDFLRGISILLVLLLHFNIAYHLKESALSSILPNIVFEGLWNGNYGVVIFFTISGFLITSRTLDRYDQLDKINVRSFYIMRFARIFPSIILFLAIVLILGQLHLSIFQNKANVFMLVTILSVITCWHNVLMQLVGYFNYCINVLWSLSVEEVFYFAFPLVCIFLKKPKLILCFLITLIIWAPIYRYLHKDDELFALYGYWACFDGIALGCIAAWLVRRIELHKTSTRILFIISILTMVIIYFYNGIMDNVVFGISLMSLSSTTFIVTTYKKRPSKLFSSIFLRSFCWLGSKSYELYLFHIILLALMKTYVQRSSMDSYTKILWLFVFLLLSAFIAYIISRFYTEPLNKKIRTTFASKSLKSTNEDRV